MADVNWWLSEATGPATFLEDSGFQMPGKTLTK
jgi:hypothetical protein